MLRAISTCARYTVGSPPAAENVGSRESAQLILMTGLVVRQRATAASRAGARAPPASSSASVRTGSALLTTTSARMMVPSSSTTPSPGLIAATEASTAIDRARVARGVGEQERHPADPALHERPAADEAEAVMGVDPRGPGVARAGERPDHALAVQGGAQPLVVHMALDDIGDRRVEQHLERLRVVGEERLRARHDRAPSPSHRSPRGPVRNRSRMRANRAS